MRFVIVSILSIFIFRFSFSQTIRVSPYWQQLKTDTYKGKQDDIFFLNDSLGWYVNGSGKIYRTINGGTDWKLMTEKPGTYFRCIGFADSLNGFAGNIGTDYFPNVSDTVPIYKTNNGGRTWLPVAYKGPAVKGLCAIDIYKEPFVNAGKLDYKTHVFAGGRVGSPAFIMVSHDGGTTFTSFDMSSYCSYILDIKFFNLREGIICAASNTELDQNHALILTTDDGGKTWQKRYESKRPYEITWKCSFPSRKVGYVTIQSYDTTRTTSQRYVAKTTDGGRTWKELPMVNDLSVREFGIAFSDENNGWVGAIPQGFVTADGGKTWQKSYMGPATNKIRILKTASGTLAYAIGAVVMKSKDYLKDGTDVIAAMRNQYAGGKWYKNFTFIQDAIFYREGKEVKKEQWYEALSFPGNLVIKFNSMESGNGVVFSGNKVTGIKEGKAGESRPFINDLLLVGFDVYFLKPY
ncbi:MAG: WD40/YVTN/BNR-like repeat-containing protein [Bacteroidia bacterium]